MKRLALALALVLAGAPAVVGAAPPGSVQGALFSLHCKYSHTNNDDPIIYPAQPGASHTHEFLGNDSTDAFSTYETLQAAATRCAVTLDKAGYWIPALYRADGTKMVISNSLTYYRNGPGGSTAFPPDFRMVARASSFTGWGCGNTKPYLPAIPDCTGKESIRAHIEFPSCWDGAPVSHVDDTAHVAMAGVPTARVCPAGFPVRLPRIEINVRYVGEPRTCVGCYLSSGEPSTLHADFINAWDQPTLELLVAKIDVGITCNNLQEGDPCLLP